MVIHSDITRLLIGTETLSGTPYVVEEESTNQSSRPGETFLNWTRFRQDGAGLFEADVATSIPPVLNGAQTAPSTEARRAGDEMRGLPSSIAARLPENQRAAWAAAWDVLERRAAVIRSIQRSALLAAVSSGGVLPGELTRLTYPLHPGAEWTIRDDPFFGSVVEANEIIAVPAGRFPSSRIRIVSALLGPNDAVHVWFSRSGTLALRYHLEAQVTDVDGNIIGTETFDYDETLQDLSLVGS